MIYSKDNIYSVLEQVSDPEVPVLSVLDLGIVRDVIFNKEIINIIITPTYSGCPAMDAIAFDIKMKLLEAGYTNCQISYSLQPAWSTDWLSEEGKKKLKAYGIAPPGKKTNNRINKLLFEEEVDIPCPKCNSIDTKLLSQFGSTACKALYQCNDCKEPFDYFKCH